MIAERLREVWNRIYHKKGLRAFFMFIDYCKKMVFMLSFIVVKDCLYFSDNHKRGSGASRKCVRQGTLCGQGNQKEESL